MEIIPIPVGILPVVLVSKICPNREIIYRIKFRKSIGLESRNLSVYISIDTKLPNHRSGWGVSIRSDLEMCLDVLELIRAAAGGGGMKVLVHMLKITAAKRGTTDWW